jgi:hypothetical protein
VNQIEDCCISSPRAAAFGLFHLGKVKPTGALNLIDFQEILQETFGDPLRIASISLDSLGISQGENRQVVGLIESTYGGL